MRSEDALLNLVARAFAGGVAGGALGFSDDAAVLPACPAGANRVVTTDLVQEGVDFRVGLGPLESAGARAIVQNVSDLCAMGARPLGFVWSLALPGAWLDDEAAWLGAFLAGAAEAARDAGLALFGGDLSRSDGPMTCSITAFGDVQGAPLLRSGARPGDLLCLSRPVGASRRGLALLLEGAERVPAAFAMGPPAEMVSRFAAWRDGLVALEREAVDRHLWPRAEGSLGPALVGRASACVDVSDGLAKDLSRLCRASGTGATLNDVEVAVHPAAGISDSEVAAALTSGEEYALLFTLPPEDDLAALPGVVVLGRIVEGEAVTVRIGGRVRPLAPGGFDHFAEP